MGTVEQVKDGETTSEGKSTNVFGRLPSSAAGWTTSTRKRNGTICSPTNNGIPAPMKLKMAWSQWLAALCRCFMKHTNGLKFILSLHQLRKIFKFWFLVF